MSHKPIEIKENRTNDVTNLFCKCFVNDHYYIEMFPQSQSERDRYEKMHSTFYDGINYCLKEGHCVGAVDKSLIAYLLCFDYQKCIESPGSFCDVFGWNYSEALPYLHEVHDPIKALQGKTMYVLSIAVLPEYRRQGIASKMLDHIIKANRDCNIVADVSNEKTLPMYEKRGFKITKIKDRYYLVIKEAKHATT